jgi:hypothetical protein
MASLASGTLSILQIREMVDLAVDVAVAVSLSNQDEITDPVTTAPAENASDSRPTDPDPEFSLIS